MGAVVSHWDPATRELTVANCGHVPPIVIRNGGNAEKLKVPKVRGLGGRTAPEPAERTTTLADGDRLIMVSDGVVAKGKGKAGLGIDGLIEARHALPTRSAWRSPTRGEDLSISRHDQIDLRIRLGGRQDQGVRHSQRNRVFTATRRCQGNRRHP